MDQDPWVAYAHLQSLLNRTTNVHKAAGIEAAMVNLLEKIERGEPCTSKQTKNLVINRIGKERRRRAIVNSGRHELVPPMATVGSAESRLTLQKCAVVCGPRNFRLLVNHAIGRSYVELAKASGVNQNTLKIRVHRLRKKISHLAA